MIETPFSPSTASRPLGRAPASMHAGLGPAVLVRRRERLPHADERINNLPLARPLRFPDDPAPARGTMRRAKEQVADLGARLACHALAQCLCDEHGASPEQIREAVALLESTLRTSQRVFGRAHPTTKRLEGDLAIARMIETRPLQG